MSHSTYMGNIHWLNPDRDLNAVLNNFNGEIPLIVIKLEVDENCDT